MLRVRDVWLLFTVGSGGEVYRRGSEKSGFDAFKIFEFSDSTEAGVYGMKDNPRRGFDFGQRLPIYQNGKVTEPHYCPSGRQGKTLVRQEEEWKNR